MLILASASPRRAELLKAAAIPFETLAVDLDEALLPGEAPEAHVRRLAEQKARTAAMKRPDAIVLGADTIVLVDDRVLGKPSSADEARAMLRRLSGRAHDVLTGVALVGPPLGDAGAAVPPFAMIDVARTRVWFSSLSDVDIDWYVASGEPMDKAGAYAIQGLASRFVERIEGSYSNVVGLPVALVWRLLGHRLAAAPARAGGRAG